jgi:hypothetical protein
VVIVAHDVNPILPHLDRVIYLGRGGAVSGTPAEVITSGTLTRLFGLSAARATLAAIVALAICAGILAIARPLLFASLDESAAAARGIPVRLLGFGFLVGGAAAVAGAVPARRDGTAQRAGRPCRGTERRVAMGDAHGPGKPLPR